MPWKGSGWFAGVGGGVALVSFGLGGEENDEASKDSFSTLFTLKEVSGSFLAHHGCCVKLKDLWGQAYIKEI